MTTVIARARLGLEVAVVASSSSEKVKDGGTVVLLLSSGKAGLGVISRRKN